MNQDEFDKLLQDADPLIDSEGSEDPMLVRADSQWNVMFQHRRQSRRRLVFAIAASAAFFIVALTLGVRGIGTRAFDTWPFDARGRDTAKLDGPSSGSFPSVAGDIDRQPIESESIHMPKHGLSGQPEVAVDEPKSPGAVMRLQPKLEAEPAADPRLNKFVEFIESAGAKNSPHWTEAVKSLATGAPAAQRLAIELVPHVDDQAQQQLAYDLVLSAAGTSKREVLLRWHQTESLRAFSWDALIEEADFETLVQLMPLATLQQERNSLAVRVAGLNDDRTSDLLIQFAGNPAWRPTIKHAVANLHPSHARSLVMRMRDRNPSVRTAAALVLALVPGTDVDQMVASYVLGGRFQQPAYMVLLARNTPQAKAFLAHAATRRELSPALVSARVHFANFEEQLQRWIHQTLGAPHVPNHTVPNHTVPNGTSQSPTHPLDNPSLARRIAVHWKSSCRGAG